jgi:ABC-2 type transport system permease protein
MATSAATPEADLRTSASAIVALARRALREARVRDISFMCLFAVVAYIQPVGYRGTYKTLAARIAFARSFANNKAIRLFYGEPHDLLTVSGYTAWRVGGTLAIVAAAWGVLAAVKALRGEEDTGRAEVVLAGAVSRAAWNGGALGAIAAWTCAIWLATWLALVAGDLDAGGSAYLALSIVSVIPVYVGVGVLASQIAPRRRVALGIGLGAVALGLMLRAVADTSSGLTGLRWLTPLGWAEELRPFTGARPWVLVFPLLMCAGLLTVSLWMAMRRDIGSGLIPVRDAAEPRLALLSSPTAQALRGELEPLLIWLVAVGVFGYVLGSVSKSVSTAGISKQLLREMEKIGAGSIATPKGYVSFVFLLFIFVVSLFACSQIAAARGEEAAGRLETLLAQPVGRTGWLAGRLALAAVSAVVISLAAALLTWTGAVTQGVHLAFGSMLLAGLNCVPLALLSLGAGALAYGIVPRAAAAIAYALVVLAFVWNLFGSLFRAPHWLLEATPFAHVGLVPSAAFRAGAAAVMIGIGAACAVAAFAAFRRRDVGD